MYAREVLRFFEGLQSWVGDAVRGYDAPLGYVRRVCAVDAAYGDNVMVGAAVVWSVDERRVLEGKTCLCEPPFPYVPGLLFLREAPALFAAVELLSSSWDVLLVDAHGRAHPREAGMATFLGATLRKPTVGIAKKLLAGVVGEFTDSMAPIMLNGKTVGYAVKPRSGKTYYISPGYGVRLEDLPALVAVFDYEYPEPLREADKLARSALTSSGERSSAF